MARDSRVGRMAAALINRKAVRLGPMSLRLLARRRRWIRWAAIVLAGVAAASIFSQMRRNGATHSGAVPVVVARRAMHAGHLLRESDVEMIAQPTPMGPMSPGPTGSRPFRLAADAVGRVALRALRPGEAVTPDNAIPVLRYYGVAARVPPGMRAINLVVPSAAMFGGELAPLSRVDILGAFEVGQERAAATLLTSGIVLRLPPGHLRPPGARSPAIRSAEDAGSDTPVEVEVAVPRSREREVILAQAFGRVFLAVHSAAAEKASPGDSEILNLRRYLNLPPAAPASFASLSPPPPAGLLTSPAGSGIGGRPGRRGSASPPAPPKSAAPSRGGGAPGAAVWSGPPEWTVEVIEGGARSVAAVPRVDTRSGVDDSGAQDAPAPVPQW